MRNLTQLNSWISLVLALFTMGLIVACQDSSSTVSDRSFPENCQPVEHIAGKTCIPKQYERVVTLDSATFEYAIASGLTPIGTVSSDYNRYLGDRLTQTELVGQDSEPNLERILTLQPDLIVGVDFHQNIYPQLSKIAPTFLLRFESSGEWKEIFQHFGEALGRDVPVQQVMAAYRDRVASLQKEMEVLPSIPQVSVIRIYPDTINLYLKDSFCGTILQDVGLARPPSQNINAAEASKQFGNPIQVSIGREMLTQADGDVIFIWAGENTAEANQQAQKKLQELQQDPLWQKLKAVRNNRVYQVPSYWIGSGPIAANFVIDDLFKHLLGDS
ncbi:iron-siderophore ABC transporter substrate-binding protein [bacterium]|nr:iron-siderophore ABC transporter substrate-binding protein [bacterium]